MWEDRVCNRFFVWLEDSVVFWVLVYPYAVLVPPAALSISVTTLVEPANLPRLITCHIYSNSEMFSLGSHTELTFRRLLKFDKPLCPKVLIWYLIIICYPDRLFSISLSSSTTIFPSPSFYSTACSHNVCFYSLVAWPPFVYPKRSIHPPPEPSMKVTYTFN